MNTCMGSTPLTETPAFRIFCGRNVLGRNVCGRNVLHSHKHDDNSDGLESHIQCDFSNKYHQHTRIQMGGGGRGSRSPPGKLQNIGFLSKTGPDPLKITKLHSIQCLAIDGPLIVVFESFPPQTKKTNKKIIIKKHCQSWTPSGSSHDQHAFRKKTGDPPTCDVPLS